MSSVQGYESRTNDIIYCPPLEKVYVKEGKELQNQAIVYFGGDIQVGYGELRLLFVSINVSASVCRRTFPRTCRCTTTARRTLNTTWRTRP